MNRRDDRACRGPGPVTRLRWETPEAQALSDKLDRWIADERRGKRRPRETTGELFGLRRAGPEVL